MSGRERSGRKRPLWFVPPKDLNKMRRRLDSADGLAWLQFFVKIPFRQNILAAFAPPDPPYVLDGLAQTIGNRLSLAILLKLARRYPRDAAYGPEKLLRYRPDETGALIIQAHGYLTSLLMKDIRRHPCGFMAKRLQRLLPELDNLPEFKGKRNIGAAYGLVPFAVYEEECAALKRALPDTRRLEKEPELREDRLRTLRERYGALATDNELERWSVWPPSKIALEIASRRTSGPFSYSRSYLRHVLFPKVRPLARALDRTLTCQGKSRR